MTMRVSLLSVLACMALLGATQRCASRNEASGTAAGGGADDGASAGGTRANESAGSGGATTAGSGDTASGSEVETCGACGEGCATRVWDPDARVAREYECTESNGAHRCTCDSAPVTVTQRVDCSVALERGCGLDLDYAGYCQTEGAGVCWPEVGADAGTPVWQCQCEGSDARSTSEQSDCEPALFHTCPVSCESETGRCASGEALYSYDCECAGQTRQVREYALRGDEGCDTLLALACEPACSGAIGRCFDLGDRIECSCGAAALVDTLPRATGCEGALMTTCADRDAETCSRVVDAGHATCSLDADGYLCACADYDEAFPGGVQYSDPLRVGAWRELNGTFTIDLDCEQAMREACPSIFE